MRAGTQTLIQALQALPWTDDADNDDELNPDLSPADSSSDEDKPSKSHVSLAFALGETDAHGENMCSCEDGVLHTHYPPPGRA